MKDEISRSMQEWLEKLPEGSPLRQELLAVCSDEEAITDRFYQNIVFGTAGLRGKCGAGTNRMNFYTVGRASRGIAEYILKSGADIKRGVAIAYDCRHYSREFSEDAARILTARGIKVYLFPSLRPTPELSYVIRKLGCISGINMTASHNPKEYNGYKVYWEDGAQISGAVSAGMQKEIEALDFFSEVPRLTLDEAREQGLLTMLGEEMDRDYLEYVKALSVRGEDELDLSIPVVYTPLNGAGSLPLSRLAQELSFTGFRVVSEQKDPDPDFTTVPYPNPENPQAFALAEKLGREVSAELLIATDPDSDRMAAEIPDGKGGYRWLNGNQTGALIISYLAEGLKEKGKLPAKAAMIKSIVTGDFGRKICRDYGIEVFETLTGFKNICGKIPELEAEGYTYFFGYEESIGCAPGEEIRDKDGIAAAMLLMEMAAFFRRKGMSMADALEDLYRRYGYFAEDQQSLVLEGRAGQERISRIMQALREGAPESYGSLKLAKVIDYKDGYQDIPPQNALRFVMEDGSWFAARPSGTEPKIKFYFYAVSRDKNTSASRIRDLKETVSAYADSVG